jgi:uncharacterized protein YebE (UPF0316 family)
MELSKDMIQIEISPLTRPVIAGALLIFALRITDVSMGTFRTLLITRGQRSAAALLGFVEVTIWVVAISQVFANLSSLWNIIAYSGGFATGTLVGMWLESKIALGIVSAYIVSTNKGAAIARAIRKAGYGATELSALGQSGPVTMVSVVLPRKQLPALTKLINRIDARSFITVDDTRQVVRGYHIVK